MGTASRAGAAWGEAAGAPVGRVPGNGPPGNGETDDCDKGERVAGDGTFHTTDGEGLALLGVVGVTGVDGGRDVWDKTGV